MHRFTGTFTLWRTALQFIPVCLLGATGLFAQVQGGGSAVPTCADGDAHLSCYTSIVPTAPTAKFILPHESHRFQQIHKEGTRYTIGGGIVPANHDFTAYLPIAGSSERGYLSINHETTPGGVSNLGVHYDATARLWRIDSSRAVNFSGADLVTTMRNCSGGVTPWGTVITSEETYTSGDANNDGYDDVGWLVEIDPATARVLEHGNGKPEKLWAIGRASHENATILSDEKTLFTGEDGTSGALFKFVADRARDLRAGKLYTLVLDEPMNGFEPAGTTGKWVEVPNATPEDRNNTRALAIALGATNFNGIEDVDVNPLTGQIHFASKGAGRIYQFTDGSKGITEFTTFVGGMSYSLNTVEGTVEEPWGIGNDNLVFDDRGNLWVLQDGDNNYIWTVGPDHTQEVPRVKLFSSMPIDAEPTGLTFSPDYRFGFFSIQHPAATSEPQRDATGDSIVFNLSSAVIFSRSGNLGEQAPVIDFISDLRIIQPGEIVTFSDVSTNGVENRRWVFDGGMPAVSTDSVVEVSYSEPGRYRVQLSVSNTQGEDSLSRLEYIEVERSTRVDELAERTHLSVFPNPTAGQLSIRMEDTAGEMLTFDLYDLTGRHLATLDHQSGTAGSRTWTYDVSPFATANQVVLQITVGRRVTRRVLQFIR
ncbi:hypothetical protein GGR28_002697 [Lewinella aquimaris]|uniref:PKD domain-containing protein n=1 Tax=Neolewinella aquimaris TaxID=1835722 RepID=A0A840E9P4_9BACT|nr:alkaline phosphatase PhoX [Neolewinella aquimaris]MBB4080067.1 hypothetical protein [Neolewinella aquimaris]